MHPRAALQARLGPCCGSASSRHPPLSPPCAADAPWSPHQAACERQSREKREKRAATWACSPLGSFCEASFWEQRGLSRFAQNCSVETGLKVSGQLTEVKLLLWERGRERQQRRGQVRGAQGSAILRGSAAPPTPGGSGRLQHRWAVGTGTAARREGQRDRNQRAPRSGRSAHPAPAGGGSCGRTPQPTLPVTGTAGPLSRPPAAHLPPSGRHSPDCSSELVPSLRAAAPRAGSGRRGQRGASTGPTRHSARHAIFAGGRAEAVLAGGGDGGGAGPAR